MSKKEKKEPMETKVLRAPKKMRQQSLEQARYCYRTTFVSPLNSTESGNCLSCFCGNVGGTMLGHFNVHGTSLGSVRDYAGYLTRQFDNLGTDISWKLRSDIGGEIQISADGYADMILNEVRAVSARYEMLNPTRKAAVRDRLITEINDAISNMFPESNLLALLPEFKGRVIMKSGSCNIMVAWGQSVYMLFTNGMCAAITDYATFELLFPRFFVKYFVKVAPEYTEEKFEDDITIGMDPELEGYYMDDSGPDFDLQCAAGSILHNGGGRVGCDGHSDIFELRPMHSRDPKIVVANTQKCFDILGYALSGLDKRVYLLTGGGILDPIGGHVHIGGKFFTRISTDEIGAFLGPILDDFIYWPIRDQMPGGMRSWGNHPRVGKRATFNSACGFTDKKPSVVFNKIIDADKNRHYSFATYELASSFRFPPHGIEYRSLPSFISNPELTHIVLTMSLLAARKMLYCYNNKEDFKYSSPPKKNDYLSLFPEKLYHDFMRYVNGDKNKVFLDNALTGWNANPRDYEPVIKITGCFNDTPSMGMAVTKKLVDVFKEIKKKYPELESVRAINVGFGYAELLGPHFARSGKLAYGMREDFHGITSRERMAEKKGIISVHVDTGEDCVGPTSPIVDSISLGICRLVGVEHFNYVRNRIRKALPTYESLGEFNMEAFNTLDATRVEVPGHSQTHWDENEYNEEYEECNEVCFSYHLVPGCPCITCHAMAEFRQDHCGCCDDYDCEHNRNESRHDEDGEEEPL